MMIIFETGKHGRFFIVLHIGSNWSRYDRESVEHQGFEFRLNRLTWHFRQIIRFPFLCWWWNRKVGKECGFGTTIACPQQIAPQATTAVDTIDFWFANQQIEAYWVPSRLNYFHHRRAHAHPLKRKHNGSAIKIIPLPRSQIWGKMRT